MPTYEVNVGADTYHVDSPTELSDAQAYQYAMKGAPPAAPQPGDVQDTAPFSLGGTLGHFASGMSKFPGQIADMLGSAAQFAGGVPVNSIDPSAVTSGLDKAGDALGFPRVGDPGNEFERVAQSAGEGTSQALAMAAPELSLLGRTRAVAPLAGQLPGMGERVAQAAVDSSAASPLGNTMLQAASGAGGAGGGQAAQDAGAGPLGTEAAQLAGGMLPNYRFASPVYWGSKGISLLKKATQGVDLLTSEGRQAIVNRFATGSAARSINQTLDVPGYADNLATAQALEKEIGLKGDATFGVARASGDERLIKQEAELNNAATGSTLQRMIDRKAAVAQGITDYAERKGPVAVKDAPSQVISTLDAAHADMNAANEGEAARIGADIPAADRAQLGQKIRAQLTAQKNQQRTALQQEAEQAGLNSDETTFPQQPLIEAIDSAFAGALPRVRAQVGRYMRDLITPPAPPEPPVASGLLQADGTPYAPPAVEPEEATLTLRHVQDVRTQLGQDIATINAGGANDKNVNAADLRSIRGVFDDYLDNVTPTSGDPDVVPKWQAWRPKWKAYADKFERDTVYKVTAPGGRTTYKTGDELIAGKIFGGNNQSGPADFLKAGGDIADLRAAALDSAHAFAVRDGAVQPDLYATWLRKNRPSLRQSGLEDEFTNNSVVANNIGSRVNGLAVRQAALQDNAVTKLLTQSGQTPEAFIQGAIKDPRAMAALVTQARQLGALPAVQRAVWEQVLPGGHVDPDKILNFLKENKRSLPLVFTADHIAALNTVAKAAAIEGRLAGPTGLSGSNGSLSNIENAVGMKLTTALSRIFNVKAGRLGVPYTVGETLIRVGSKQFETLQNKALQEMLVNPQMARDLATATATATIPKPVMTRLRSNMILLGMPPAMGGFQPPYAYDDPRGKTYVPEQRP